MFRPKNEYKKLRSQDPKSMIFKHNVVLWRSVSFEKDTLKAKLSKVDFVKQDKGNYAARVSFPGKFLWEPEVNSDSGIILFLEKKPAENWTHLIVSGTSKGLRSPGVGGALFAKAPEESIDLESYCFFREEIARSHREDSKMNFEEKVISSLDRIDTKYERLIISHSTEEENYLYNYCFISPEDDEEYRNSFC